MSPTKDAVLAFPLLDHPLTPNSFIGLSTLPSDLPDTALRQCPVVRAPRFLTARQKRLRAEDFYSSEHAGFRKTEAPISFFFLS